MKKKWLLWSIAATLVLAIVVHVLTIYLLPVIIMDRTIPKYTVNKIKVTGIADYRSKRVVATNPDMFFASSAFDLKDGPLIFSAPVPVANYWSISLFADNSDNFFVVDDRQVKSSPLKFILVTKGMKYSNPENVQVVISPSTRGILLIRQIVPSPDKLSEIQSVAEQASLSSAQ